MLPPDQEKAIGILEGKATQKNGIDDAEDGAVCSNAHRQRQHDERWNALLRSVRNQ